MPSYIRWNEPGALHSQRPCDDWRKFLIMESLVKKKQKGAILELKRRHLKNTIFCTYTPYPAMKIRRISASSAQETRNDQFLIWRTDISNITRKPSKTDKHGHDERKSRREAKDSKPKPEKIKPQSKKVKP
ncbi:hypothetical protein Tco_1093255 [Tanacetum coccineum]|uniref:Uncharacterized protein n=1 Tax=Tanacetum coccineum TaxID=301880 RepID=A0ABQ5IE58_9ASTR